ncbi:hypothetical protein Bca52824_072572 [Brassica carinata]|uniref:Uncharacterized protein n=1 Tax=Brassica carinata TaxID=52824 RepID=A0A8X7Q911_BRACI|nr:hypothetical protein Bca52824_072572 [Brassica carinata]
MSFPVNFDRGCHRHDNWILDTIPRSLCNPKIHMSCFVSVCHSSRDVVVVRNSFSSKWFLARVCFLELVPPCGYQYKKENATLLRAQNALVFEQMRYESASVLVRAKEDADMW